MRSELRESDMGHFRHVRCGSEVQGNSESALIVPPNFAWGKQWRDYLVNTSLGTASAAQNRKAFCRNCIAMSCAL
jgi:hypothetical protein